MGNPYGGVINYMQMFASGHDGTNVLEFGDMGDMMKEITCIIEGYCKKECAAFKYSHVY